MESDWSRRNKSHYVTEIVSWLGFADVIFGGDKRQLEIRLRSQADTSVANGLFTSKKSSKYRILTAFELLSFKIELFDRSPDKG